MAEVEDGPKFPAERSNRRDFPDTKEEFEVDGPKGSKGVGGSKHHHHLAKPCWGEDANCKHVNPISVIYS